MAKKRVTPPRESVPHAGSGQKPHDATPELRARVRALAMIGYTQKDCYDDLRISEPTFKKYYLDDFDQGNAAGRAKIAETGYHKAVGREAKYSESGKVLLKELEPDTNVLIFMLRARLGMKDSQTLEVFVREIINWAAYDEEETEILAGLLEKGLRYAVAQESAPQGAPLRIGSGSTAAEGAAAPGEGGQA